MRAGEVEGIHRGVRGFAQEGFAVLEGFLDPALVATLRREVDVALAASPPSGCERPHNRLAPLGWNAAAVRLILQSATRRDLIKTLTDGDDLRWISGYVSAKEPSTPALCWHQDWWCWHHPISLRPAAAQVAVLCYLTDTTERNGALRVLPRSHRVSLPLHATLAESDTQDPQLPLEHPALSDQPGQVTLRAGAGDAVVLDYRLLHGTHANGSAARRDCVLLSFTPSWRGLPSDIRAHLIRHPAQPVDGERPDAGSWAAELLPSFAGAPADLELDRVAPSRFAVRG